MLNLLKYTQIITSKTPPLRTDLIIFAIDQGQFEAVLCGVDGEHTRPALPVQAINAVASHAGHIDGQVQGPDDAMITTGTQRIS